MKYGYLLIIFFVGCQSQKLQVHQDVESPSEFTQAELKGFVEKKGKNYWDNVKHGGNAKLWQKIENQNNQTNITLIENKKKNTVQGMTNKLFSQQGVERVAGHWIEKGSYNIAGRMDNLDYSPANDRLVAISASGQIWESYNENSWQVLNDGFKILNWRHVITNENTNSSVTPIIKLINDGNTIVVSEESNFESQVYVSDNGQNWIEAVGFAEDTGRVVGVWEFNGTVYLLRYSPWSLSYRLYKSINNAHEFTLIDEFVEQGVITQMDTSVIGAEIYIVYKVENQGYKLVQLGENNYQSLPLPFIGDTHYTKVSIASKDNYIYLAFELGVANQIYLYDRTTKEWKVKGLVNERDYGDSFTVDAVDKNTVYLGGQYTMVSYDAGLTWSRVYNDIDYNYTPGISLHADSRAIKSFLVMGGESLTYIANDAGMYLTKNKMHNVINLSMKNLNTSQIYDVYTSEKNPHSIFVAAQDQGVQVAQYYSSHSMKFKMVTGSDGGHLASGDGGSSVWASGNNAILYFHNGGTLLPGDTTAYTNKGLYYWDFHIPENYHYSFNWLPHIAVANNEPQSAYIGMSFDGVPSLWQVTYDEINDEMFAQRNPFDFSLNSDRSQVIIDVAISSINPDYRYVVVQNLNALRPVDIETKIFTTTDAGVSWDVIFLDNHDIGINGVNLLPSAFELGRFYIFGSQYYRDNAIVYQTEDNGATFLNISKGMPRTMVNAMVESTDKKYLFAASDAGPFIYSKSLKLWQSMYDSVSPLQVYTDVEYIEALDTVRFATYGRGVWDFKIENQNDVTIDTSYSGIYEDPNFPGKGLLLNITSNNQASIGWYTYGKEGRQRWIVGDKGKINGNTIEFNHLSITNGTNFGINYNQNDVVRDNWGSLTITFDTCDRAWMSYSENMGFEWFTGIYDNDGNNIGPKHFEFGRGLKSLKKLAGVNGLTCENGSLNAQNVINKWTGVYQNPDRTGEYLFLQQTQDSKVVGKFFSYTNSHQMWLDINGTLNKAKIRDESVELTHGGLFGSSNNPINRTIWGKILIHGNPCGEINLEYSSADFGVGILNMQSVSKPIGVNCL